MERRNCSYALHFPGKCSKQMRKPQRNSAWEARLSVLRQGLRRSFALSHTALLSGIVKWKALSCNGKPYCAMESGTACNGKVDFTKADLHTSNHSSQHRYLMIPYCTFMSKMRSTD